MCIDRESEKDLAWTWLFIGSLAYASSLFFPWFPNVMFILGDAMMPEMWVNSEVSTVARWAVLLYPLVILFYLPLGWLAYFFRRYYLAIFLSALPAMEGIVAIVLWHW
jgi:hypothetical protein